jgi:hypothetical protein
MVVCIAFADWLSADKEKQESQKGREEFDDFQE